MKGKDAMKNKKFLALVFAIVLTLSLLAACGFGETDKGGENTAPVSQDISETTPQAPNGDPDAMDIIAEIVHDGDATKINDPVFDEHFDTTAAEGIAALLAEGKIYVNGVKIPASDDETVDYQVNGVSSLYKTASGWGFNVHKSTSADNLSFEDARLGFYETITTVRGHTTTIYGDASTGLINKIDSNSYDVARATEIVYYNESITIVRGNFELETNRVRPDVNNTVFHSSRFDADLAFGDFMLFYYSPNGWVAEKAVPMTGTLGKTEGGSFIINAGKADEYEMIESNVSRYNLINCNRPTQFYNAYIALGLQDVAITMWCTPTGHPIGFTYGDKASAKEALSIAIEHASAAKEGVVVSEDGSGVASGNKWVAQADLDAYDEAIAAAKAAFNKNSTAVQEFDDAIYQLALALGEGGEKPTGFIGAQGEGA